MSEATQGSFGRRRGAWLAALAGGSLALSAFLGVYGDLLGDPPTWGADGYSRSAIGHRAALDLARRLGVQVLPSRHRTADKAADEVVVALLEPDAGPADGPGFARLADVAGRASRILLVLPKRQGPPDPLHPGWLGQADLVSPEEALAPLRALESEDGLDLQLEASLVRPSGPQQGWHGELPVPALDRPQLLRSKRLTPLLATDDGMVVGELEEDQVHLLVLADPDVLATHGLGRGENALLFARLLERLGADARPLVVDETLHGLEVQPSIVRELLRFPLLLATLQALLVAALLAWAALVRFGRPLSAAGPPPGGAATLVESAAALLLQGGHAGEALAAYLKAAKEEALRRLHVRGEAEGDAERALRRLLAARGREEALTALEARVRTARRRRGRGAEEEAVRTAQEIHRWREELTDGAAGHP